MITNINICLQIYQILTNVNKCQQILGEASLKKTRKFGTKNPEMSQFQFGNFENGGGGPYFSKMSQF